MTFLPAKQSAFAVVTTPGTPPDSLDFLLSKKGASKYYSLPISGVTINSYLRGIWGKI